MPVSPHGTFRGMSSRNVSGGCPIAHRGVRVAWMRRFELTFLAYRGGMRGDEARVARDFAGWLSSQGWTVRTDADFVDIVAEKDGRRLYVEVKGASAAPGLDVDTAIGQLVRRMPSEADQSVSFALVVCDEPLSVEAGVRAPQRILDLLGMALYAVDEDGGVRQLFGRA